MLIGRPGTRGPDALRHAALGLEPETVFALTENPTMMVALVTPWKLEYAMFRYHKNVL